MKLHSCVALLFLFLGGSLVARTPCGDIVFEVGVINNEQDYLFSAYLDAQFVSDYEGMGEITAQMSDNFFLLSDLEIAYCDYACDEEAEMP